MHIELAIEKLKTRHEQDKKRAKKKITKTAIAKEAGVSVAAVSAYFNGNMDSDKIDAAFIRLVG